MRPLQVLFSQLLILSCTSVPQIEGEDKRPYVLLISIDGYRHDYTDLYEPPHLMALRDGGSHAKSLIPVYPSKTFPNHYSIITGLYTENHGLLSNKFYDRWTKVKYSPAVRSTVVDPKWYGGKPLWSVMRANHIKSASYFWVGSEVTEGHPDYFFYYDPKVTHKMKTKQVLEWLKLPIEKRPRFITLYFPEVDDAGHDFGPRSDETKAAVLKVDKTIGNLLKQISKFPFQINVIIVSDHGMEKIQATKFENFSAGIDLSKFVIVNNKTQVYLYGKDPAHTQATAKKLRKMAKHYEVFLKSEIPSHYFFSRADRVPDIVLDAEPPYLLTVKNKNHRRMGDHGWAPSKSKNMEGIFYVKGPALKAGMTVPSFRNIHIYPLILEIMKVPQEQSDGSLDTLKSLLN